MGEKRTKRRFFGPMTAAEMAERRQWRWFRRRASVDVFGSLFAATFVIFVVSMMSAAMSMILINVPPVRPEYIGLTGLAVLWTYYDTARAAVWFGRQRIWVLGVVTAAALAGAYWLVFHLNGGQLAPSPPDLALAVFAACCAGLGGVWLIVLLWCRPPIGRGETEREDDDRDMTDSPGDAADEAPGVTLTHGAEFLVAFSWVAVVIAGAIGAAVGYFGSTVVWWVAGGVLPVIGFAAVVWWRAGVPVRVGLSERGFSLSLASGRRVTWAPGVEIELDDIAKCNCGNYRFLVRARSRWVRIDERYFECSAGDLLRMALSHGVDGELEVRRELFT